MRHLLSVDDLTDEDIERLILRAGQLAVAGKAKATAHRFSLATMFFETSLRTRVGFAEAAIRLGGVPIDIDQLRDDPSMSHGESFEDSVRVVTGMVDLLVVRTPLAFDRALIERQAVAPVVNGGGGGEHPSQALIDAAFLRAAGQRLTGQVICLCGDMRSRVAVSSLKLFARFHPRRMILAAPPSRRADPALLAAIAGLCPVEETDAPLFEGAAIIDMVGLARVRGTDILEERARARYRMTRGQLKSVDEDAVIISPLPNIDEIALDTFDDPRMVCLRQSDFAVFMRMAVIEHLLAGQSQAGDGFIG